MSGLSRHLASTSNPRCTKVRQDAEMFGSSEHEESDVEPNNQNNAPQFQGDYFGDNYGPGDFGWENENEENEEPEMVIDGDEAGEYDSSDEEDTGSNIDDEDQGPWEPPIAAVAQENENRGAEPSDGDVEMGDQVQQDARNRAEEETQRQPSIVQFPRKRKAGEVLHQTENQYCSYKNGLDGSETNNYAPFKSKVDWEFAKWAKTRGPGSNTVSELLQIEGVY